MKRRGSLRTAIGKELRMAWPVVAAALAAMVVSAALAGRYFRGLGIPAYAVGVASLGARAFGHEFTLKTMQSLLVLPRSRRSTMAIKLAVLVALLVPLAVAGRLVAFRGFDAARDPEMTIIFWLPLATAVGVAPWLTLVFRSAIAGMAFSLATPGFIFTGAVIAWAAMHGDFIRVPQSFVFGVGWIGTLGVSLIGFVLAWTSFERLEVVDGSEGLRRPHSGPLSAVPRRMEARRCHPLLLLVQKELRLQRMTFYVSGAYVLTWLVVMLAGPAVADEVPALLTVSYIALVPFMPGSLASAEEHQLGTVEWQATLPVASWKQWLVKVAVVLGVAVVLAIGVPVMVSAIPDRIPLMRLGVAVVILTAGSLYASSACHSSLSAMLTAIMTVVVTVPLALMAVPIVSPEAIDAPLIGLRIGAGLSIAAIVLTLAMFNHRTLRDDGRPPWRHATAAVGCAACTMLALAIMA